MILTHASRRKDFTHTSFAEIRAFKEILQHELIFRSVEIRDFHELESVGYVEDLTIFAAGHDMNETVVELANICKNLYIVVQDPNWPTSLARINREFTLITPFRALESLDHSKAMRLLKRNIPSIETRYVKKHHVIDFGSMLVYNERYLERYWDKLNEQDLHKKDSDCYIGSLKKDRIEQLSYIANRQKVSFYGNFTREDFVKMSYSTHQYENCEFLGKIEPSEVLRVYMSHKCVIFCPDDKIFDLDTSYLRIGEMCLAECTPLIVSRRKDIANSLDHLTDEDGKLRWSNFVRECHSRDMLAQIKKAYSEVLI